MMMQRPARFHWRRWYAPVVVMVALLADYGSPAALWTAFLPLAFMAVLLTHRETVAALAVLCLSSWIFIPTVAVVSVTADRAGGERTLYGSEADAPGLDALELAICGPLQFKRTDSMKATLLSGAEGVRVPSTYETYMGFYNRLALWSARRAGEVHCSMSGSSAPRPSLLLAE
jgi:hypothetical protein